MNELSVQKKIGKLIASKRRASGLSQKEIASKIEIGSEAYSRIERGVTSPSIHKLYQLAEIFRCSVDSLLVDASPIAKDQALKLEILISGVPEKDRKLVISILTTLCKRLAKPQPASKPKRTRSILDEDDFLV